MKRNLIVLFTIMALGFMPAGAAVKIAAALPDLGSIASYIGGGKVEVFSIAKSNSNPHSVEVLPSYMIKVSRADIYLKVGLELDQWSDDIIDGSRNGRIAVVDCSEGIPVLEKPSGKVDSSMGDVHPEGNPHYWYAPSNGVIIAGTVLEALKKADPDNAGYYESNYLRFKNEAEKRSRAWQEQIRGFKDKKIICYHASWVYFADFFGLVITGNVEPLPGIPPTAKHLAGLVDIITKNGIKILLQEPYFPDSAPKFLARETGVKVIKMSPSCGGAGPEDYFAHFDEIIKAITQ